MFGSRRRKSAASRPTLTATTADPNAATAAAVVFRKHASNTSLSAAAAAAALRARPITPTNVAGVQTKRSLRRNASVSSASLKSDSRGGRPDLRRRGSSGSMTERTFRSPSPSSRRPSSSGGHYSTYRESTRNAPPVPALPKDVDSMDNSSIRSGASGHRSLKLSSGTPLRLASQRLASENSSSWFGGAKVGDTPTVRRTDPAMASPPSSPPQLPQPNDMFEDNRPGSRASINFSYPSRTRVGSPPLSPVEKRSSMELPRHSAKAACATGRPTGSGRPIRRASSESGTSSIRSRTTPASCEPTLVYDPNSRRMVPVPRSATSAMEHAVLEGSEKPTRRRKKQSPAREDSHMAQTAMGPTRTNVPESGQEAILEPKSDGQPVDRFRITPTAAVSFNVESPGGSRKEIIAQAQMQEPQYTSPKHETIIISPQPLRRQPSIVREEPDLESGEEDDMVPVAAGTSNKRTIKKVHQPTPQPIAQSRQERKQNLFDPARADPTETTAETLSKKNSLIKAVVMDSQGEAAVASKTGWNPSISPARQAHFGPFQGSLTVRHSPPARSVSPRKSALKQHSPASAGSPSDDALEASASLMTRDERAVPRRKSVRVSFDDEHTVYVGMSAPPEETDSSAMVTPQYRDGRRWYSSVTLRKKETTPLDDDEVMKPRPALPSFGSVREKTRDSLSVEGERPLVRPLAEGPTQSLSLPTRSAASSAPPSNEATEGEAQGARTKRGVGSLLTQEQPGSQNTVSICNYQELLPPIATSVEGGDCNSSTASAASSISGYADASLMASSDFAAHGHAASRETASNVGADLNAKIAKAVVPSISISEPSPSAHDLESRSPHSDFFDIPGRFPEDESDPPSPNLNGSAKPEVPRRDAYEAVAKQLSASNKHQALAPTSDLATELAVSEPSDADSEHSSLYSDAYEDLSDIDGDGFQSLDAVVESPVGSIKFEHKGTSQKAPQLQTELSTATTVIESPQPENIGTNDWERAKLFWRGLTVDKRAQFEREAIEEAGTEADLEGAPAEMKPKRKKSLERRDSESKALARRLAQQMMAEQDRSRSKEADDCNPERTYQVKPGTKWANDGGDQTEDKESRSSGAMRKTMRRTENQPSAALGAASTGSMRKLMRPDGVPNAAGSARASTRERPASFSGVSLTPAATKIRNRRPSEKAAASATDVFRSSLTRRRRDSTDSESSFKRSRAAPSNLGLGMRASMRQTSTPPASVQASRPSSRFSLRALSPSRSSFKPSLEPSAATGSGLQMKRTLRDSSTYEGSKSGSGPHMPHFGGPKTRSSRGVKPAGSRFERSDGGRGLASGFRSRFTDSSDEESVVPMLMTLRKMVRPVEAPTKSRHRRKRPSDASTTLPEEEEEESDELPYSVDDEKKSPPRSALAPSPTAADVSASLVVETRPHGGRRGSILSVLWRKKPDVGEKMSHSEMTDSAARRDTELERNIEELRGSRDAGATVLDDGGEPSQQQLRAHRLHKRTVSFNGPSTSNNWPLTNNEAAYGNGKEDGDALSRSEASGNLGTRTMSSGAILVRAGGPQRADSYGSNPASSRKRKKFSTLRKMFKLDD